MDIFEHLNLVIAFVIILYWFFKSLGEKAKKAESKEEHPHVPPIPPVKSQSKKIELQDRTFQSNVRSAVKSHYKKTTPDDIVPLNVEEYHYQIPKKQVRSKRLINRLSSKKDLLAYSVIFGPPKALNPRVNDLDHSL